MSAYIVKITPHLKTTMKFTTKMTLLKDITDTSNVEDALMNGQAHILGCFTTKNVESVIRSVTLMKLKI